MIYFPPLFFPKNYPKMNLSVQCLIWAFMADQVMDGPEQSPSSEPEQPQVEKHQQIPGQEADAGVGVDGLVCQAVQPMKMNDHMPGIQPLLPNKGPEKWGVILDDDAEALLDERFGKPLLVGVEASLVRQEDDRWRLPAPPLL